MSDQGAAGAQATIVGYSAARAERDCDPVPDLTDAAIGLLYNAESAKLLRFARRRTGDLDEAADLVQDAFARLLQVRLSVSLRTPAAYLRRILRNLLNDRIKRADHRLVDRSADPARVVVPSAMPEQEWQLEAADLMNSYRAAIDTLPPRTREVFLLHRVDELRYREIAERLRITVSTVEYHMTRALVHLDEALGR